MSVATALFRKSMFAWRNAGRIARSQSRFKVAFVLCFAVVCEGGLWVLFRHGFWFLDSLGGAGGLVLGRLFALFFLGVGTMLAASSILTAYASMFRSEEIPFLVARPLTTAQIVRYKFIEATALSSWAYFVVVIPFIGAYAWHERMSLLFVVWAALFSFPFLTVWSGLGTRVMLLFVRSFPRGAAARRCALPAVATVAALVWFMTREVGQTAGDPQFLLSRLAPGMALASSALAPSAWLAEGIMALTTGQWVRGGMMFGVLLAWALMLTLCIEAFGRRVFYDCWQRVVAGASGARRKAVLFAPLDRMLSAFPIDVRAMVLKDLRSFVRDPMQWSQTLVFFGLLAIYFANLRSFNYEVFGERWRSLLTFLNVFSVSAVMSSLGSRFVYPQLSLEGQGFWILGLSPVSMRRVVLTKFAMAASGMLTIGVLLMLMAAIRLRIGVAPGAISVALVAAVSLAVCGLSTGLGAIFLDLKQRNPSAIVSGFGGTLNLVLSLGFMLLAILPFAALLQLAATIRLSPAELRYGMLACWVWLAVLTALVTAVPLWMGIRSFQRRDY
jgi:ABC-2 type transport system permease protein